MGFVPLTAPKSVVINMHLDRNSSVSLMAANASCLLNLCQLRRESLIVSFQDHEGLEAYAVSCHFLELCREV